MSWHRFMTGLARTMKDGDPGAIAVPQAAACGLEVERGADTRDKCSVSASSERLHCTQVYTSLAPRSPHTYTPLHTACCRAQRLIYISEMRTEAPGGRRREEPARRLQCLHWGRFARVHRTHRPMASSPGRSPTSDINSTLVGTFYGACWMSHTSPFSSHLATSLNVNMHISRYGIPKLYTYRWRTILRQASTLCDMVPLLLATTPGAMSIAL